jgi:glycosyltransferase involved in cell wall biosynthesis
LVIVFCISNFTAKNCNLQPWLTIYRISKYFLSQGHEVHAVTNHVDSSDLNGISIHFVDTLRGTNSKKISELIDSIHPDALVVDVNPMSLVTARWYRNLRQYRTIAYLSYPFYNSREIVRALPHIIMKEKWEFGRHILIPRYFWARRMVKFFDTVICQSGVTGKSVTAQTHSKIPVHVIPPGIDKELWTATKKENQGPSENLFLYLGAASAIRGFSVVLDAFALLSDHDIKLKVLARGADGKRIKQIEAEVIRRNIQKQVSINGGLLEIEELKREIIRSKAVLLPFVLVPSELPVTVMESIACGTPVIVSNINGLSEAAGDAGIVVSPGDPFHLATAIKDIYLQKKLNTKLRTACTKQADQMISWHSVSDRWLKTIEA